MSVSSWVVFLSAISLFYSSFLFARTLSYKEAIQYALESSPAVRSAQRTLEIRELEYRTATARFLPSLDLSATHGLQNNFQIGDTTALYYSNTAAPWYSALSLALTESLYDNGASWTNRKIADLNRELAQINYEKTRDSVILDVTSEFNRFSLLSVLFELRKQQLTLLEKQFRSLTTQYQQGFKTKSDFLRLKTQVQRAQIENLNAQNSLNLSGIEMRKILGVKEEDSKIEFEPSSAPKTQKVEINFPKQEPPFERNFEYRRAQVQDQMNDKSVSLVERKYWPEVNLTAGINYSNLNYLNSGAPFNITGQFTWNALIAIRYNIWDWGIRKRDVEIARFNYEVQGNTIRQTLLDSRAKVSGLMLELVKLDQNYRLTRDLLSMEEESYQNLENFYREGKVAYLDLMTGMNNLLDAKIQFYSSYFDSLSGIAKFHFFEGTLYESIAQK